MRSTSGSPTAAGRRRFPAEAAASSSFSPPPSSSTSGTAGVRTVFRRAADGFFSGGTGSGRLSSSARTASAASSKSSSSSGRSRAPLSCANRLRTLPMKRMSRAASAGRRSPSDSAFSRRPLPTAPQATSLLSIFRVASITRPVVSSCSSSFIPDLSGMKNKIAFGTALVKKLAKKASFLLPFQGRRVILLHQNRFHFVSRCFGGRFGFRIITVRFGRRWRKNLRGPRNCRSRTRRTCAATMRNCCAPSLCFSS